jgi:hypothetical protein
MNVISQSLERTVRESRGIRNQTIRFRVSAV